MSKADQTDQMLENGGAETPHFFALPPAGETARPDGASVKPLVVAPAAGVHLRSGDLCPHCQGGPLDYDGLLNLACARCGYTPGGGCFS